MNRQKEKGGQTDTKAGGENEEISCLRCDLGTEKQDKHAEP